MCTSFFQVDHVLLSTSLHNPLHHYDDLSSLLIDSPKSSSFHKPLDRLHVVTYQDTSQEFRDRFHNGSEQSPFLKSNLSQRHDN